MFVRPIMGKETPRDQAPRRHATNRSASAPEDSRLAKVNRQGAYLKQRTVEGQEIKGYALPLA